MLLFLITSAYITELLGLHALFGAFIAGVVMPNNAKFRNIMTEKVEDVSLSLFLPLFFASTGLRTEIGRLNTPELWVMCGVFIAVAIIGKFGGSYIAARVVGESRKDSLYIGALMNTRGLMELVILTIGYEMRILPPEIFVILVLMTLVTTFMTTPMLGAINLMYKKRLEMAKAAIRRSRAKTFDVLLSFGRASNGSVMLDVAKKMFATHERKLSITALHLSIGKEINPLHTNAYEKKSFAPILDTATDMGITLTPRYEVANDASAEICRIANEEDFNFLLVGAGISLSNRPEDIEVREYENTLFTKFNLAKSWFYPGELLRDKTRYFVENANCPVGILVNRNRGEAKEIIVYEADKSDRFLMGYAKRLAKSEDGKISSINATTLTMERLAASNFMLVSYSSWNIISEQYKEVLQVMPTTLIINK